MDLLYSGELSQTGGKQRNKDESTKTLLECPASPFSTTVILSLVLVCDPSPGDYVPVGRSSTCQVLPGSHHDVKHWVFRLAQS